MFVTIFHFPPIKAGQDAEFHAWFAWSNAIGWQLYRLGADPRGGALRARPAGGQGRSKEPAQEVQG